ncbi:MAG: hypothetical protein WC900_08625 [Oscillospiraceae bacterium]
MLKVRMKQNFECILNETEYNSLKKDEIKKVNEKDFKWLVYEKQVAEIVKEEPPKETQAELEKQKAEELKKKADADYELEVAKKEFEEKLAREKAELEKEKAELKKKKEAEKPAKEKKPKKKRGK